MGSGFMSKQADGSQPSGRTARAAAAPLAGIGQKVLNAMGAGAVASVIQAALSAVGEPIVNRVLVKRMKVMDAIKDVSPAMMLDFFKTTLATNFLKFPFFEAINAFCAALPIPPSVRDIVYGIVRNYCTIWTLAACPQWTATAPQALFIVVILGCLGSAPFNEWRGYLLQSKGQELTFKEFFKPSNFVRSTSLGAIKQGLALAVGYWCAPPAQKFVNGLFASIRG